MACIGGHKLLTIVIGRLETCPAFLLETWSRITKYIFHAVFVCGHELLTIIVRYAPILVSTRDPTSAVFFYFN